MTATLEPTALLTDEWPDASVEAPEHHEQRRPRADLAKRLQLLMRVSMAGTYIGHGAFGIIGKEAWLPYFNLFGFTDSQAWALQPFVGTMDISFGILILLWPMRALMLHLSFWGVLT